MDFFADFPSEKMEEILHDTDYDELLRLSGYEWCNKYYNSFCYLLFRLSKRVKEMLEHIFLINGEKMAGFAEEDLRKFP